MATGIRTRPREPHTDHPRTYPTLEDRLRRDYAHLKTGRGWDGKMSFVWMSLARKYKMPVREIKAILGKTYVPPTLEDRVRGNFLWMVHDLGHLMDVHWIRVHMADWNWDESRRTERRLSVNTIRRMTNDIMY